MLTDTTSKSLPIYEALASQVRLQVINLLTEKEMNVSELAQAIGLSTAIMTMHVKKLQNAGIIRAEMTSSKGGLQKLCSLIVDHIEIEFPKKEANQRKYYQTSVSVGHYTNFNIEPTCGLATTEKIIGEFDDPRFFLDPERVNAKILWFYQGDIEYRVPNYLLRSQTPSELEIQMEISSEAPFTNDNWPSDISFYMNEVLLGVWTSPGDYGDKPGKFTPAWWPPVINQYGLLKTLRVTHEGTYMDGNKLSEITLDMIDIERKQWTFRLAVQKDARHVGGVTIFGAGFGNYNHDILFTLYYSNALSSKAKS